MIAKRVPAEMDNRETPAGKIYREAGAPDWVILEGNATLGHSPGYRPSDAAREVVRAWKDGWLTLESFCASRMNDPAYNTMSSTKCVCGKHHR